MLKCLPLSLLLLLVIAIPSSIQTAQGSMGMAVSGNLSFHLSSKNPVETKTFKVINTGTEPLQINISICHLKYTGTLKNGSLSFEFSPVSLKLNADSEEPVSVKVYLTKNGKRTEGTCDSCVRVTGVVIRDEKTSKGTAGKRGNTVRNRHNRSHGFYGCSSSIIS